MTTDFQQQLRQEFDLSPAMAVWVVITHVFVLACPLALIWAVVDYAPLLPRPFAHPLLIIVASAVYIGATAFEVAQNSADRWYLTEATRSVADLFFNTFMTAAFCLYTIGFLGLGWAAAVTVALTAVYPFAYIHNHPSHRGINGMVVLIATIGLYQLTGDPLAFMFLVGTGVGVFFITFLVKQHAQWLHGLAAFFFGLAFLAWPWAVVNAANGRPLSWLAFGASIAIIAALLAAASPVLGRAKTTPHQFK